ncbi:hypothetical protein [Chitinophaga qingshengii]|uniref:SMI1/KNR4 family protein n=1 Tax=Chitinophaga qingshengii TaxID=1569794 RepID=A0ABR7THK3_9BACT|nr:hypothetical protein [Chitinophaga qingshengii]MBC9929978.1 hypothetical protein [Chitinophaga qingshengii]
MAAQSIYPLLGVFISTLLIFGVLFLRKRKKARPVFGPREDYQAWQQEFDTDMERVTKADIRELMSQINLPPSVFDLFDEKCTDAVMQKHRLDKDYTYPYSIIDLKKNEQDAYHIDRYKPILAYAHATIFAYDTLKGGFTTYYIEGDVDVDGECFTWDGLFCQEILRWWEYEIPDEDILYIGEYFGLKHTSQILDSINAAQGFSSEEQRIRWKNETLIKINGIIK